LLDYNVQSIKKSFFPLCPARIADFDRLWCKILQLRNFGVLHHHNENPIRYL
jgi:hypothetical protein